MTNVLPDDERALNALLDTLEAPRFPDALRQAVKAKAAALGNPRLTFFFMRYASAFSFVGVLIGVLLGLQTADASAFDFSDASSYVAYMDTVFDDVSDTMEM